MTKYYSKRNMPISKVISYEFWQGFKAYIQEIQGKGWLDESFGEEDFDQYRGVPYWYIPENNVNSKMLQELGHKLYPLDRMPNQEIVLDLIQFFFKYVSAKAKYEYTIGINRLFDNFNIAYELRKGIIKDLHSKTLDKVVFNDSFEMPDGLTRDLLNLALDKFYSRNQEDKKIALEKLVDVYQRISSWENKDKKRA